MYLFLPVSHGMVACFVSALNNIPLCGYHSSPVHLLTEGHLGCLQGREIMNQMSLCITGQVWTPLNTITVIRWCWVLWDTVRLSFKAAAPFCVPWASAASHPCQHLVLPWFWIYYYYHFHFDRVLFCRSADLTLAAILLPQPPQSPAVPSCGSCSL